MLQITKTAAQLSSKTKKIKEEPKRIKYLKEQLTTKKKVYENQQ